MFVRMYEIFPKGPNDHLVNIARDQESVFFDNYCAESVKFLEVHFSKVMKIFCILELGRYLTSFVIFQEKS